MSKLSLKKILEEADQFHTDPKTGKQIPIIRNKSSSGQFKIVGLDFNDYDPNVDDQEKVLRLKKYNVTLKNLKSGPNRAPMADVYGSREDLKRWYNDVYGSSTDENEADEFMEPA